MSVSRHSWNGTVYGRDRCAAKSVLVVHAEPEVRDLLTEFVARLGLIAVPVPGGAHAELMCEKLALDLILLDAVTTDEAGAALVDRLKVARPATPVVAIAGAGDPPAALAVAGRADAVVPKPLELACLREVLVRLLELPRPPSRGRGAPRGR